MNDAKHHSNTSQGIGENWDCEENYTLELPEYEKLSDIST